MGIYQVCKVVSFEESENPKYGKYVIKDLQKVDSFVYISSKSTQKSVLKDLKALKAIKSSDSRTVSISDITKDIIEVKSKKTQEPLCRLDIWKR